MLDEVHIRNKMYFRQFLCSVALATLASAAVAKQIPTPYSGENYDDANDEVFARDAEAEADPARKAAWEHAHGGATPSYKFGQHHDAGHHVGSHGGAWHVARDAEAEAEPGWAHAHKPVKPGNWASWLSSALPSGVKNAVKPSGKPLHKQHIQNKHGHFKAPGQTYARDVEEEGEDEYEEFDYEGLDLDKRGTDDEIPDFGDEEVDTSLEGLLERDVDDEDYEVESVGYDADEEEAELARRNVADEGEGEEKEDDDPYSLEGYDPEILARRSAGDEDIDYSLEGYDDIDENDEDMDGQPLEARDLSDEELAENDEFLESQEHRDFLADHGVVERDVEEDEGEFEGVADGDYVDEEEPGLEARDIEDDVTEDLDDEDTNADAAYADEPVADELEASAIE